MYFQFVFPLLRDEGYEFIVAQFAAHEAHFTPLINYQVRNIWHFIMWYVVMQNCWFPHYVSAALCILCFLGEKYLKLFDDP